MAKADKARRTTVQNTPILWVGGKIRVMPFLVGELQARGWFTQPYTLTEAHTGSAALSFYLLSKGIEPPKPTMLPAAQVPLFGTHVPQMALAPTPAPLDPKASYTPSRVILADAVAPLLAFYALVRNRHKDVQDALQTIRVDTGGTLDRPRYEALRTRLNFHIAAFGSKVESYPPDAAARFLVLNWAGYNGLWRTNRKGESNVPWGSWTLTRDWDVLSDQVGFSSSLLRTTPILDTVRWDALQWEGCYPHCHLLREIFLSGDAHLQKLIYVDPPYPETYSGYANPWQLEHYIEFRKRLEFWAAFGAQVAVSFPAKHRNLLPEAWETVPLVVPDLVGQSAASRGSRDEVLVVSPSPSGARHAA